MYIFIDESGIHKTAGHSTIVLVFVIFKDIRNLEQKILKTENSLHIRSFHWANYGFKRGWNIREQFIRNLSQSRFRCKAAIFKNPINFRQTFEETLQQIITEKKITKIIIDGRKPKWYERQLKKTLRDKGISVRKLRTGTDQAFPVLRLADALAGLIRSYYDKPEGKRAKALYNLIKNKITPPLLRGEVR